MSAADRAAPLRLSRGFRQALLAHYAPTLSLHEVVMLYLAGGPL